MKKQLATGLFILWVFVQPASAATVTRHEVGPWPFVSQLIGYQDRIWFANIVKGKNHNSADIYSVPLSGGPPRYERHLFSQDAGDPVVHRGLLYWPYEDARAEPGIGVFDATDGERWEHGDIPTEQAFHVHAMAETKDHLYATPSAWKASIARSGDGGVTWDGIYVHLTADRRVRRVTALAALDDRVFGTLSAPEGRGLIRVDNGSGRVVRGWPVDRDHAGFAVHGGWLYGLVTAGGEPAIWRTDGSKSERVWMAPDGWQPTHIESDGHRFWMSGLRNGRSVLWQSKDAHSWDPLAVLDGGAASSLIVYRGVVAVGGQSQSGIGILWLIADGPADETDAATPAWPPFGAVSRDGIDWREEAKALDALLSAPESYRSYGAAIRRRIAGLPRAGVPANFYTDRLDTKMPEEPLPMFGGIVLAEMADMGLWRVYWGMGLARSGHVRPEDILRPADYTPNEPMKFFSTAEIAMWAAGRIGASNRDVLNALITRLEEGSTPLWLKGDAVGALTAITHERFGYNAAAWRTWFDEQF